MKSKGNQRPIVWYVVCNCAAFW